MARRHQPQRAWPFKAALPPVWGMSAVRLTNLALTERAAMNAVHTQQSTRGDIQVVLVGLAAGLDVAHRASEDEISELHPARVAIAEGLLAALAASDLPDPAAVPEAGRHAMERGLRLVEQLREVARRQHWLEVYSVAMRPGDISPWIASMRGLAQGLAP